MAASFRLMTANLLVDECDPIDLARVLEVTDPDVVVTQELGPFCAEVVRGAYPNHRLRSSLGFTGRGIATKFDAEFGDMVIPGRRGIWAELDVGGRVVRLAGMHLLNPLNFPWWLTARVRRRQLEGLFDWLDEGRGPVVVAGDFNASPAWPAYKEITGQLVDLVAEWSSRNGARPERTWAVRPGWPRLLRIDHVFGRGVTATDVTVAPIVGTDHRAVIVDLEVSDET